MSNLVLFEGLDEFFAGAEQVVPGPSVLLVVELHVFPVWKKTAKKARQPYFAQKACDPLFVPIVSPFMNHLNTSLRFLVAARRVKNIPFSRICVSARKKKLSACCGLNFDATDLPHS